MKILKKQVCTAMCTTKKTSQNGGLWPVVFAVLIGAGGLIYYVNVQRAEKRITEAARIEKERLATEQLVITQKRLEAQKQTDAFQTALKSVDALVTRWEDASNVASATGRGALATPVAALQAIKREAESLIVPPCLDTGKAALVIAMGHVVEAYLAFMLNVAKVGDISAAVKFDEAKPEFEKYKAARVSCRSGQLSADVKS